jgi:hypothetical protein
MLTNSGFTPLASNTVVRTSTGDKTVAQLCVGDVLFDDTDKPVKITAIGDTYKVDTIAKLTLVDFRREDQGKATAKGPSNPGATVLVTFDHQLACRALSLPSLEETGQSGKRTLTFLTRCVEGGELGLLEAHLAANLASLPSFLEAIRGSDSPDELNSTMQEEEAQIGSQPLDSLPSLPSPDERSDAIYVPDPPSAFPLGPLLSSEIERSLTPTLRATLAKYKATTVDDCGCGGCSTKNLTFASPQDAAVAKLLLLGGHSHLVDSNFLPNTDRFNVTSAQLLDPESHNEKTFFGLFRCPSRPGTGVSFDAADIQSFDVEEVAGDFEIRPFVVEGHLLQLKNRVVMYD